MQSRQGRPIPTALRNNPENRPSTIQSNKAKGFGQPQNKQDSLYQTKTALTVNKAPEAG